MDQEPQPFVVDDVPAPNGSRPARRVRLAGAGINLVAYADDGTTLTPLTVAPIVVPLDALVGAIDLEAVVATLQRQVDAGADLEQ